MNNFEETLRSIYDETKKIKLTTTNNEKHKKKLFKKMVTLTEDIIYTLPVIEKSKLNKSLDETLDKCKLTKSQKKELKTTTNKIIDHFLKRKKKLGGNEGECPICFNDFEENPLSLSCPQCNNKFHKSCLTTWLNDRNTCPMCRRPIEISSNKLIITPIWRLRLRNYINNARDTYHDILDSRITELLLTSFLLFVNIYLQNLPRDNEFLYFVFGTFGNMLLFFYGNYEGGNGPAFYLLRFQSFMYLVSISLIIFLGNERLNNVMNQGLNNLMREISESFFDLNEEVFSSLLEVNNNDMLLNENIQMNDPNNNPLNDPSNDLPTIREIREQFRQEINSTHYPHPRIRELGGKSTKRKSYKKRKNRNKIRKSKKIKSRRRSLSSRH
jgi:E3 ubiquitin-protein ligase RNF115/126